MRLRIFVMLLISNKRREVTMKNESLDGRRLDDVMESNHAHIYCLHNLLEIIV